MAGEKILVIDDEEAHAESTGEALERSGYQVFTRFSGEAGAAFLEEGEPVDLVLTDLVMHAVDGMEILQRAKRRWPDAAVIVMTGYATVENAVAAMKAGAEDYLRKPLNIEEVREKVRRALERQKLVRRNNELERELDRRYGLSGMIGSTAEMQRIFTRIQQIAATSAGVLISGETGTGKELVAQAIHRNSPRRNQLFLPINCTAFNEGTLESQLFGHEKGAFTGALAQHKGYFEHANKGTLFLDEIGDMPLAIQAKLLRALDSGEILRIGSNTPIRVDVRIIGATNRDLEQMVREKGFREDLFYRINVVNLTLPPLRERAADIPLLIESFIKDFSYVHNKRIAGITPAAQAVLLRYHWPGNVRELKNCLEAMVAITIDDVLDVDDLSPKYLKHAETAAPVPKLVGISLEQAERELIKNTLASVNGNREECARILGIGERTLYRKIKEYQLPAGTAGGGA
ncbi:MAG: sigma-54-dependent Fis family transcriptional regulator, partial [Planctomycetes bacterium]|nr:sigma-54-dependent Fis family transcriptional regulator [Planctomycetota bacterium]